MPQLSAIWFAARRARQLGIPVIADGGITYSGDIVKAIAAGAETVMLGSLLAGTDEAPGELELFEGRRYKTLPRHGVDGRDAGPRRRPLRHGAELGRRRGQPRSWCPRASRAACPTPARSATWCTSSSAACAVGMGYAGAATLDALRNGARFMRVTTAGRNESHPHDVTITKEAPNYQRS